MRACYATNDQGWVFGTVRGFRYRAPARPAYLVDWFEGHSNGLYFQGLTAGRKLPDTLALLLGIYHEND